MSPLYATQNSGTSKSERIALERLEQFTGGKCYGVSNITAPFDSVLIRSGELQALVEVKTRTCTSTEYATYMIDKGKVDGLISLADSIGVVPVLLVAWTDSTGVLVPSGSYASRTGGRYDRNDPSDIEVVVDIPIKEFKRI